MNMKKVLTALGVVGSSALAFAEEGATGTANAIVEVADVTDIFTNAQDSMGDLIAAALPVVIAFVGGGLIIWGALALVSLLKRGFGAGKGR